MNNRDTLSSKDLRKQVLSWVKEYYRVAFPEKKFVAGETYIPYAGKVFDAEELVNLVDSSLDFWLTSGRYAEQFEKEFAEFIGVPYCSLVNSGSSANLLALTCLTSPKLGEKRLWVGDEVITAAVGFPTTLNPIIQNNLVPVFIDVTIPSYNIDVSQLEKAYSNKVKAIMIAHTLGNPFDVEAVIKFALEHDLYLIEDTCDALGSTYNGKNVGTFGDLATFSFYPAHHMTLGEAGAVVTKSSVLNELVTSFRDWGRDCHCKTGQDNACGKRFSQQFGDLPFGYDHKYVWSHIGYNLKVTDMQAAIGVAQLKKLPSFIEARKANFKYLYEGLKDLGWLMMPEATKDSDPSWFGFPISTKGRVNRHILTTYLEEHKIATRLVFGGNLLRQPAYKDIKYRKVGNLENSDFVMNNSFFIGVYPALTKPMLDYMIETIRGFVK